MCPSREKQRSADCREITGPSSRLKPHLKHFFVANKMQNGATGNLTAYPLALEKDITGEGFEVRINVWSFSDKRYKGLPSFFLLMPLNC